MLLTPAFRSTATAGLLIVLALASTPLLAGGSAERVLIEALTIDGVDYTLVVAPAPTRSPASDPNGGSCKRFEVRGTYRWLKGTIFRQEENLSRRGHLEALEYLRKAFATTTLIKLGVIGTGFVPVDPAEPCVVESRALELIEE